MVNYGKIVKTVLKVISLKKATKIIVRTALVIVLLIALLVALSRAYIHVGPYKSWEKRGIGVLLPSLSDAIGKSEDEFYIEGHKGSNSFAVTVHGISHEDYQKYVDAAMESGFTMDFYRSDYNFHAYHTIAFFKSKRLSLQWFEEDVNPFRPPYMSIRLS